ncbi:hypothetical protein AWZ03_008965 [Drosophila navojoa]|uniref:Chitin-binding type-2 domain-containing protein n=2 Tax=Drosophila navojoa TaxID=7232 RepID=A0A484B7N9_DRONA|nr:hypothetical protein AWZ03_008965 [Drosophila navojoa]
MHYIKRLGQLDNISTAVSSKPDGYPVTTRSPNKMKVFALTLLSLAALAQARLDYKLQCTREEVGIRWPSYFSNSEYYVCQSIYGNQLTVHCPPGEVFTFVLQQCAAPALYVPAPPMDVLPTDAPITTHVVNEVPPMMAPNGPVHMLGHEHELEPEHMQVVHASPLDPTPPTPPTEPPTPPTVVLDAPKPGKKPAAPQPHKKTSSAPTPAKAAAAKKPAAPSPPKAGKKPTPPNKAQKKPSTKPSA